VLSPRNTSGPSCVLELCRGVDVAQKQADDIGIVGKFQRVGFGCGDAVADSIRVAACVKLLKAAKSGRAVLVTGGQRHRVPPKIDRRANTDAGGDNLPPRRGSDGPVPGRWKQARLTHFNPAANSQVPVLLGIFRIR
jgi:hypothetical protein